MIVEIPSLNRPFTTKVDCALKKKEKCCMKLEFTQAKVVVVSAVDPVVPVPPALVLAPTAQAARNRSIFHSSY